MMQDFFVCDSSYDKKFKIISLTFATTVDALKEFYNMSFQDGNGVFINIEFDKSNPYPEMSTVMITPISFFDDNYNWHIINLSNDLVAALIEYGLKEENSLKYKIPLGGIFEKTVNRLERLKNISIWFYQQFCERILKFISNIKSIRKNSPWGNLDKSVIKKEIFPRGILIR